MTVVVSRQSRPDAELIRHWQTTRDPAARRQLVERYDGLARTVAARYVSWGEPFDDLLQVAWLGMLKALERFDLERGLEFSTFAIPTMVGELRRHFRDRTWAAHVPRSVQELRPRVHRATMNLTASLHRQPTPAEVAELLNASTEQVLEVIHSERARVANSLTGYEEDSDVEITDEERGFAAAEARALLGTALDKLDERDRLVLRLRYEEELSQSQIADRIGVSQMHVSRLLRRAVERLRDELGETAP